MRRAILITVILAAVSISAVEAGQTQNGYAYDPAGRRDPFTSAAVPPGKPGCSLGLACVEVSQAALMGIAKDSIGWMAMLRGPDGTVYLARVGARLFDGCILAVNEDSVIFRVKVQDAFSPNKERDVTRALLRG
ncbi:MAG: hypothetical protein AB1714_17900 [Acidobacteriota bacterium]